ncbi:hypothetical protein Ndes2526B_g06778 [Nannochloris sp. 'desiccata']|nr:hypothetical protein KSW81_005113 [Chlorella desiccata (nom. nud.)]KAH7617889.1 hypothetical protein NADE_000093 [Chlorella desiccata (nom. nud.)]
MKYKNAVLALHGLDAATDEDLYAADKYACDVQHIMRNGDNGIPADAPEWVAELQTSMETRVATGVVAQMTAAIAQMTAAIAQLNVTMNAGFSNQAAAIADLRQDGNALKSDVNALTVRIGVLEHSSSAKRIMALTHNKNCTGLAYPLMSVPKSTTGEMPTGFPRTLEGKYSIAN